MFKNTNIKLHNNILNLSAIVHNTHFLSCFLAKQDPFTSHVYNINKNNEALDRILFLPRYSLASMEEAK